MCTGRTDSLEGQKFAFDGMLELIIELRALHLLLRQLRLLRVDDVLERSELVDECSDLCVCVCGGGGRHMGVYSVLIRDAYTMYIYIYAYMEREKTVGADTVKYL